MWPAQTASLYHAIVMPAPLRDLTDAQWAILDQLIPEPERRTDGRGRPWRPRCDVLNGILYVLRTAAPWADLPERYPPYQTCHRRELRSCKKGPGVGKTKRGKGTKIMAVADSAGLPIAVCAESATPPR